MNYNIYFRSKAYSCR